MLTATPRSANPNRFEAEDPPTLITACQDVLILLFFLVVPSIVACGLLAFVFGLFWSTR